MRTLKKNVVFGLFVVLLNSCSQGLQLDTSSATEDPMSAILNLNERYLGSPILRQQSNPDDQKEPTQSSEESKETELKANIALQDIEGFLTGAATASRGGKYAIIATGLGYGIYKSLEVAEKQKPDSVTVTSLKGNPFVLNPYHPGFLGHAIPFVKDYIGIDVGAIHNEIIYQMYASGYDFNEQDDFQIMSDILERLREFGIENIETYCYELLQEQYDTPSNEYVSLYVDVAFQLTDADRLSYTHEFMDIIDRSLSDSEAATVNSAIAIAYHSFAFWNCYVPIPQKTDFCCVYFPGQEKITYCNRSEALLNLEITEGMLLYPVCDASGNVQEYFIFSEYLPDYCIALPSVLDAGEIVFTENFTYEIKGTTTMTLCNLFFEPGTYTIHTCTEYPNIHFISKK